MTCGECGYTPAPELALRNFDSDRYWAGPAITVPVRLDPEARWPRRY